MTAEPLCSVPAVSPVRAASPGPGRIPSPDDFPNYFFSLLLRLLLLLFSLSSFFLPFPLSSSSTSLLGLIMKLQLP